MKNMKRMKINNDCSQANAQNMVAKKEVYKNSYSN